MIEKKRIAVNTILLYFRMILTMGVTLYTSRIVLKVLGISDFGLYNVVGGVVSMFAFLNGSLSAGTSRFITYDLGLGDTKRLKETFNVALVSHIALAVIILLLTETIGLWFVNNKIVFMEDRRVAINVVYQLSILTLMFQLTQIPYNAVIIAHEKMKVYAYVSILDVSLKLVMLLLFSLNKSIDNLILYGIVLFFVQLVVLFTYRYYCYKHCAESHWQFCRDKERYKNIFSFSGWDIIGSLCVISQGQGLNILLNIFFGPVVNAARAIAYQIEGAFTQLTGNFMTAVNPQIVKSFAAEEYDDMHELINDSSKLGFFLLSVFLIPVIFKIDYVLHLWLQDVPAETNIFSSLIMINLLIRVIARPVINGTHATGKIKRLNLLAGSVGLLPLPISYILFKNGYPAVFAFWTILLWGVCANILEIVVLKLEMKQFNVFKYVFSVYGRCLIVALFTVPVDYLLSLHLQGGFIFFIFYYLVAVSLNVILVFIFGFDKNYRKKALIIVSERIYAKKNAK